MQGLLPLIVVQGLMSADATLAEVAQQQQCLIETVAREAGGESLYGIQAVTEVIDNRAQANYKGKDWCSVVHYPGQFAANEGTPRPITYAERIKVSQVVYSYLYGSIPRVLPEDTFHFINPYTANDLSWYAAEDVVATYDNHHFLKI